MAALWANISNTVANAYQSVSNFVAARPILVSSVIGVSAVLGALLWNYHPVVSSSISSWSNPFGGGTGDGVSNYQWPKPLPPVNPSEEDVVAALERSVGLDQSQNYFALFSTERSLVPKNYTNPTKSPDAEDGKGGDRDSMIQQMARLERATTAVNDDLSAIKRIDASAGGGLNSEKIKEMYNQLFGHVSDLVEIVRGRSSWRAPVVVFLGVEKAGKSSLLEYLTGLSLTYVATHIATKAVCVFKFRRSPQSNRDETILVDGQHFTLNQLPDVIKTKMEAMKVVTDSKIMIEIIAPWVTFEIDYVDVPGLTNQLVNNGALASAVTKAAASYIENEENIILYIFPVTSGMRTQPPEILQLLAARTRNVIYVANRINQLQSIEFEQQQQLLADIQDQLDITNTGDNKQLFFVGTPPVIDGRNTNGVKITPQQFRSRINTAVKTTDENSLKWAARFKGTPLEKFVSSNRVGVSNLKKIVQKLFNEIRQNNLKGVTNDIKSSSDQDRKSLADAQNQLKNGVGIADLEALIKDISIGIQRAYTGDIKVEGIDNRIYMESYDTEIFRTSKFLSFHHSEMYPPKVSIAASANNNDLKTLPSTLNSHKTYKYKFNPMMRRPFKPGVDMLLRGRADMRNRLLSQNAGPDVENVLGGLHISPDVQSFKAKDIRSIILEMANDIRIAFTKFNEVTTLRLLYNWRQLARMVLHSILSQLENVNYSYLFEKPAFLKRLEDAVWSIGEERSIKTRKYINDAWWQTLTAPFQTFEPHYYADQVKYYVPDLQDPQYDEAFNSTGFENIPINHLLSLSNPTDSNDQRALALVARVTRFGKVWFATRLIKFLSDLDHFVHAVWIEPIIDAVPDDLTKNQDEFFHRLDLEKKLTELILDKENRYSPNALKQFGFDDMEASLRQRISFWERVIAAKDLAVSALQMTASDEINRQTKDLDMVAIELNSLENKVEYDGNVITHNPKKNKSASDHVPEVVFEDDLETLIQKELEKESTTNVVSSGLENALKPKEVLFIGAERDGKGALLN